MARLPRQSESSFQLRLCSRPANSQVRPAFDSSVATSDSEALVYFCSLTPRPRAISGTWSSGNTSSLRLSPITATWSPSASVQMVASSARPDVQDVPAGAFLGREFGGVDDEAASGGGRHQVAAALVRHEEGGDVVLVGHLDQQAHRLAVAAAARQVGGLERVGPPVGGEQEL